MPAVRWTTPADIPTKAISRIEKLADHDWAHALITAEYLVSQPVTGMMIREIAINGVHTKWIEQNATLLLDLIGPPEDELPDGSPLAKLSMRSVSEPKTPDSTSHCCAPTCARLPVGCRGFQQRSTHLITVTYNRAPC